MFGAYPAQNCKTRLSRHIMTTTTSTPANKPKKPTKPDLAGEYLQLFQANPSPKWTNEDAPFSLDQPWPYEFPVSETCYGVEGLAYA